MVNNIDYVITGRNKQEISKSMQEILFKFNAIEDNIDFIVRKLYEEYPMDSLCQDPQFKNNPLELVSSIDRIVLDTDDYLDEFCLMLRGTDDSIVIEVETKEVAIRNDLDFVNLDNGYSQEELDTYCVGGTLSVYNQLPNTELYFKFM